VDLVQDGLPSFEYAFAELPPGRVGFRRWRWELWHGPALMASGWRLSARDARRALRTAASRRAHELLGLSVLRPERAIELDAFAPGAVVRLDCGALTCVLEPRRPSAAAQPALA
jgi:hypothetical protein